MFCDECIFTLRHLIEEMIIRQRDMSISFNEKAFGRVEENLFRKFFRNSQFKLVNYSKIIKELRKEGKLSPFLFIITIDVIIKQVKVKTNTINIGYREL